MTSNNTKELKECQQLCKDLDYLIIQDSSIREEIIDEYVYLLSNRRIEEMQKDMLILSKVLITSPLSLLTHNTITPTK